LASGFKSDQEKGMSKRLQALNNDLAAVSNQVRQSLVTITNGSESFGAGTIWHGDGLVITNAHVVRQRSLDVILPDGEAFPAEILAVDRHNDLAALYIEGSDLPTIELGDSRQLQPGQWVMAMGHPWGVPNALSGGIVIGMGDSLPEMAPGREWIALSLRLRPGHSGGPLVDVNGRLVGINTMISGPEVGFAVPVHVVKDFLKQKLGSKVAASIA
jgi:serine protease Do